MAAFHAGSRHDPLVGRVENFLEIRIGADADGHVMTDARYAGAIPMGIDGILAVRMAGMVM